MPERKANAEWNGTLKEGSGKVRLGSGLFEGAFSFATRMGDEPGTNPEELLGASLAGCYAMALNATLGRKSAGAARTLVTATVTADKTDAGIKLVSSNLKVTAEGLFGVEKAQFAEIAREAEGKCPISNALRGTMKIDVEADVK